VRNAIDLAHVIGVPSPRVAILAAVETVNPNMPATLDAAALCKMADRGQISGGLLDGPLAFDNAVSIAAARTKGIVSDGGRPGRHPGRARPGKRQHAGQAARCTWATPPAPASCSARACRSILTSRADSRESRIASCAIALMLAHHYRRTPP
jgi:hypothetical protein